MQWQLKIEMDLILMNSDGHLGMLDIQLDLMAFSFVVIQ